MREIKFRAFVDKNIIEGYPASIYPVENICWREGELVAINLKPCEWIDSKWVILMQYTSLVDEDGKEIYEGDLLKYADSPIYTVSFSNGEFIMVGKSINGSFQRSLREDITHFMKVIGNIYENKELLSAI